MGERGFSKFVLPFDETIEKWGWSLFCTHKPLGFATVAKEFYANMAKMKEDSVHGLKNKKRKEMDIVEVAKKPDEEENEELRMGQIPEEIQLPTEEEMQIRRSSIIHSPPNVRETFSD